MVYPKDFVGYEMSSTDLKIIGLSLIVQHAFSKKSSLKKVVEHKCLRKLSTRNKAISPYGKLLFKNNLVQISHFNDWVESIFHQKDMVISYRMNKSCL